MTDKLNMQIVHVISEHKKISRANPVKPGHKRVEAVVKYKGFPGVFTKHIDIPK